MQISSVVLSNAKLDSVKGGGKSKHAPLNDCPMLTRLSVIIGPTCVYRTCAQVQVGEAPPGCAQPLEPGVVAQKARCPGGSPYQIFQNQRFGAAKRLATPEQLNAKGALQLQVRQKLQQECKATWEAMHPEERQQYKELYQARHAERKRLASDATQRPAADPDSSVEMARNSHWSLGVADSDEPPTSCSNSSQLVARCRA